MAYDDVRRISHPGYSCALRGHLEGTRGIPTGTYDKISLRIDFRDGISRDLQP